MNRRCTTVLKSPPETKKIPNDQPTQLFGSILVESPPKMAKSGKKCIFVLFWLIFTQPGFSLHTMVFVCNFLGWFGVGVEHGSLLSFCIFGVFAFWGFLALF